MNLIKIYKEIAKERKRQNELWGEQNFDMIRDSLILRDDLRNNLEYHFIQQEEFNDTSWYDILMEEVCEAFLEHDPERQREEMVQVAAVAVQIIEYLDRQIKDENKCSWQNGKKNMITAQDVSVSFVSTLR